MNRIARACSTAGSYVVTDRLGCPLAALGQLLDALRELAPEAHQRATQLGAGGIPAHALRDEQSAWWSTAEADAILLELVGLLNANAPAGFALMPDGEALGFFPLPAGLEPYTDSERVERHGHQAAPAEAEAWFPEDLDQSPARWQPPASVRRAR